MTYGCLPGVPARARTISFVKGPAFDAHFDG